MLEVLILASSVTQKEAVVFGRRIMVQTSSLSTHHCLTTVQVADEQVTIRSEG